MAFSRKKVDEPGAQSVVLTDANGEILFSGDIYTLPILEDVIIQKSIEFFNDPEPCYIHKGAVCVRLWREIELEVLPYEGRPVPIDQLPEVIRSYIKL